MGFYLRCAIAHVDDDARAERILATAAGVFPSFVRARRFTAPFRGVIAAYDPVATSEQIVEHFAAHGFPDEDAATEAVEGAIWDHLAELSLAYPGLPFAYVDVDCFGGTCRYSGEIVQDGAFTHVEPTSADAHVRLFAKLGVPDPQWYFPPFTRGYMESGVAADEPRAPVTYYVHARWDEPLRLAAIRASMLPPPWKVTMLTEQSCIVVHGDKLVASLNAVEGQVDLRAKSFVDLTLTRALVSELADDDVTLELKDPDGKPV